MIIPEIMHFLNTASTDSLTLWVCNDAFETDENWQCFMMRSSNVSLLNEIILLVNVRSEMTACRTDR